MLRRMRSPILGRRLGIVRWPRFRRLGKTVHYRKASLRNARNISTPPSRLQLCLQLISDAKDHGDPFRAVALLVNRSYS